MEPLRLELDPAPGYRPRDRTPAELEVLTAGAAERSRIVIDGIIGVAARVRVEAAMDVSVCKGEWCAADRLELEPLHVVTSALGGAGRVARYAVGTNADGEWEVWGHGHRVELTLVAPWGEVRDRWSDIVGPVSSAAWKLTVAALDGILVTRRAWSWLLEIDAPEDVLDGLRRRHADWIHGRNHGVICIVAAVSSRPVTDNDPVRIARRVLEDAGWTELDPIDETRDGDDVVVRFAATVPKGSRRYAYRDPPFPH